MEPPQFSRVTFREEVDESTANEEASVLIDERDDLLKIPRQRSTDSKGSPENKAMAKFRERIQSTRELVFISPFDLDLVREISDRAVAVITDEARWFSPDSEESVSCVVKTYRPGFIRNSRALDELIDECRQIHGLDHRHMIRILGLGCFESSSKKAIRNSLFVVEEFGGTWSLYKILKSKRLHPNHPHVQFTPSDCLRWLINIAEALVYLHERDIVHRDIKPENVWLTDEDVHECEARLGDLKPHRHNFRLKAHGHAHDSIADQEEEGGDEEEEEEEEEEQGESKKEEEEEKDEPTGLRVLVPSTSNSSIKHRSLSKPPSMQDSRTSDHQTDQDLSSGPRTRSNVGSFTSSHKKLLWKDDGPSDPISKSQEPSPTTQATPSDVSSGSPQASSPSTAPPRPLQVTLGMETTASSAISSPPSVNSPPPPPPSVNTQSSATVPNPLERRSNRLAGVHTEEGPIASPNLSFLSRESYRDRNSRSVNPLSRTSAGTPQSRSGKIAPFMKVSLEPEAWGNGTTTSATGTDLPARPSPSPSPLQSMNLTEDVVQPLAPNPAPNSASIIADPSLSKMPDARGRSFKASTSLKVSRLPSDAAMEDDSLFKEEVSQDRTSVDDRSSAASRTTRLMHSRSMGSSMRRHSPDLPPEVVSELASVKESLKSPRLTMSSAHWVKRKEKKKSRTSDGSRNVSDGGEATEVSLDGSGAELHVSSHSQTAKDIKRNLRLEVDSSDTDASSDMTSEGTSDMTSEDERASPFEDLSKVPLPHLQTDSEAVEGTSSLKGLASGPPASETGAPPEASATAGDPSFKRLSNQVEAATNSSQPGDSPRPKKKVDFHAAALKILNMQSGLHSILKHSSSIPRMPASPSMTHLSEEGKSPRMSSNLPQLADGSSPSASMRSHELISETRVSPSHTRTSHGGSTLDFATERSSPNPPALSTHSSMNSDRIPAAAAAPTAQEETIVPTNTPQTVQSTSDRQLKSIASLKDGVANHLEIILLESTASTVVEGSTGMQGSSVGGEKATTEVATDVSQSPEEAVLHTTSFAFQNSLKRVEENPLELEVQEGTGDNPPEPPADPQRGEKKKVRFKEGLPEGFAPTEDYSLIYAPPEYIANMSCETLKGLTPKSDVFSFAKLMYEVLNQGLINPAAALGQNDLEGWHTTSEVLFKYAKKVAGGYREKLPIKWSVSIASLITQCLDEDPFMRPSMAFVLKRLKAFAEDPEVLSSLEPPPRPPDPPKPLLEWEIAHPPRKKKSSKKGQKKHKEDEDDEDDDDEHNEDEEENEHGLDHEGSGRKRRGSLQMALGSMIERVSFSRGSASKGSMALVRNSGGPSSPFARASSVGPQLQEAPLDNGGKAEGKDAGAKEGCCCAVS